MKQTTHLHLQWIGQELYSDTGLRGGHKDNFTFTWNKIHITPAVYKYCKFVQVIFICRVSLFKRPKNAILSFVYIHWHLAPTYKWVMPFGFCDQKSGSCVHNVWGVQSLPCKNVAFDLSFNLFTGFYTLLIQPQFFTTSFQCTNHTPVAWNQKICWESYEENCLLIIYF